MAVVAASRLQQLAAAGKEMAEVWRISTQVEKSQMPKKTSNQVSLVHEIGELVIWLELVLLPY